MRDNWEPFTEVNFADESKLQYHVDTRDFHVFAKDEPFESIELSKIDKRPENFYHTNQEVKDLVQRLFTESGGAGQWRFLSFEGYGHWVKYLRIYRYGPDKLLICHSGGNEQWALSKQKLNSKINQESLCHH